MRSGLSALRGVVCLLGVMALTGAKTNGCGPDFDDGEPPIDCPPGTEFRGQGCEPVDPPACPPDSYAVWACPVTASQDGPDIAPDACWIECLPVEPICPDGTVEQIVCEDEPMPLPFDEDGSAPDDPTMPPHGGACWSECVPVDPWCPPGTHEEWVCPGCTDEDCYPICVPDDPCPPGSRLDFVCDELGCYEVCIPADPCPPGSYLGFVCDEFGCYEACIPDGQCAPGEHLVVTCYENGPCFEECVPDDPNQCPPGTFLDVVCDPHGCYEVCSPLDDGMGEPPPQP